MGAATEPPVDPSQIQEGWGYGCYFDMDGKRMSLLAWAELFEDMEARTLAFDEIDNIRVRTVWLGMDEDYWGEADAAPRIFGTAVWMDEVFLWDFRTTHRAAALRMHEHIVAAKGRPDDVRGPQEQGLRFFGPWTPPYARHSGLPVREVCNECLKALTPQDRGVIYPLALPDAFEALPYHYTCFEQTVLDPK